MAKNLELQSKNYKEIRAVAAADIVDGELQTEGSLNGFPIIDVDSGDTYALIVEAEKVKAVKTTGAALAAGAAAYWVNATSDVSSAGDILIGYAQEAAVAADTHVNIVFDGSLAFAKL